MKYSLRKIPINTLFVDLVRKQFYTAKKRVSNMTKQADK